MEKKLILCLLCVGFILITLCVIENRTNNKSSNNELSNTMYYDRDEIKISQHLALYPSDFDSLEESNAFVVVTAYTHGREYWDAFLEKSEKGEKCSIDIITFGTEGDPAIMYWEYNGTNYYQYADYRDSSDPTQKISTYDYLYCFDVPEDEYKDIEFSSIKGKVKEVFLSNKKFDSYDDYYKYLVSSSYNDGDISLAMTIWPLTKENFQDVLK